MDEPSNNVVDLRAAGARKAQGSRPEQEDEYLIITPEEVMSECAETVAVFAVFDGHGTGAVSKHAKAHFPALLLSSPDFRAGHYEKVMQYAIDQEDKALMNEYRAGKLELAHSGSTVSIAVLDIKSGMLVIGNVGDSHILMAERGVGEGGVRNVERLTRSHKPEDTDEKKRIEDAGGSVHSSHEVLRVGTLNMSRALGDLQYKTPLNETPSSYTSTSQEAASGDPTLEKQDYVTVKMSFKRTQLQRDKQYILAATSDGVTNALGDEKIMGMIGGLFGEGYAAGDVAQRVVDEAARGKGSDNATCVVVFVAGVDVPPVNG